MDESDAPTSKDPRGHAVITYLDDVLHADLVTECESDGRSKASVLRLALRDYLDNKP